MDAYLIVMVLALIACIVLFICETYKEIKRHKEYKEYIQSIKVGDMFAWQDEPDTKYTDPFVEKKRFTRIVTISDIKENGAGYKWVQYYSPEASIKIYYTDDMESFLRYRKKISAKDLEN